jgi:hypothetical protein
VRTSDALCRATSPRGAGSLPAPRRYPEGRPAVRRTPHEVTLARTPYVELRRARLAGPAAGLGRRTPNRTRAPSVGSTRISRSGRAWPRLLFTHTTPPRTLSLAASLGHLVKGWLVASSYPASALRRTRERCVSPTSATDLRSEHPLDCPIPGCAPRRAARSLRTSRPDDARRPTLGQWPPVSPQVKLRLTANLQLQPCRNPFLSRALGLPRSRRWP